MHNGLIGRVRLGAHLLFEVSDGKEMDTERFLFNGSRYTRNGGRFQFRTAARNGHRDGIDNIAIIKACCEYLSRTGYLRWFLKEIDGWYYLACQAGDV